MNIALAQIAPKLGDVEANVQMHLDILERARRKKADLVVFPELGLTGYTLKDLAEEVALDPALDPRFRKIVARSKGLSVVLGFVEESPADRGLFYNAAAFIADGKILHVHRKVFLPTGGMFEEAKFFAQGREFRTFRAPFGRAGLLICRDFLHYGSSYVLLRVRGRHDHRHLRGAGPRGRRRPRPSRRAGCGSSWARPSPTSRRPSSSMPTGSASRTA